MRRFTVSRLRTAVDELLRPRVPVAAFRYKAGPLAVGERPPYGRPRIEEDQPVLYVRVGRWVYCLAWLGW